MIAVNCISCRKSNKHYVGDDYSNVLLEALNDHGTSGNVYIIEDDVVLERADEWDEDRFFGRMYMAGGKFILTVVLQ